MKKSKYIGVFIVNTHRRLFMRKQIVVGTRISPEKYDRLKQMVMTVNKPSTEDSE